ncbi:trypsin [Patella vulgata]|uniref:trypsin n=1 Tax=Patella vulgata TaxID=6465 RepID=UPI0024A9E52F|nr:trypsin [Patella vulgata]
MCSTAYFSSQLYSSCCQQSPFINTQAPPVTAAPTTTTTTTTLTPITKECGISTKNPATRFAAFTNVIRQFRIVGGVNTEPCEYPWMVRLQAGDSLCGGTIIDETHIMTAGHCIGSNTAADMKVIVGEYNFNKQEANNELFDVSAINLHPNYNEVSAGAVENDIAILTLSRPLTYSDCVQPICLAQPGDSASLDDTQCTTIGWGTTSYQGSASPILQEVTMPTFSGALCASNFPNTTPTNTNLQICAGRPEGGADSCQGDSGGPLFCPVNGQYVQYGIVSYGDGCALSGNAGVYTDVGAMSSFINSVI